MHFRKKHPTKVQGNKCAMCQWHKMMGNSVSELNHRDRRSLDRDRSERRDFEMSGPTGSADDSA